MDTMNNRRQLSKKEFEEMRTKYRDAKRIRYDGDVGEFMGVSIYGNIFYKVGHKVYIIDVDEPHEIIYD